MNVWEKIENAISGGFGIAFRFLGSQSPMRTSLGVFLGIALFGSIEVGMIIAEAFNPDINPEAFAEVSWAWFVAIGILILYFPVLIKYINPMREEILDENLDKVFAALRKTFRDGNIDPITQRKFYIQIAQAVVDKVNLKPEIQEEIRQEVQPTQEPESNS
ncbi:MAG: hypothetical protein AAF810_07180 [Cyanobacteria bacterium P01_D01_bin.36]